MLQLCSRVTISWSSSQRIVPGKAFSSGGQAQSQGSGRKCCQIPARFARLGTDRVCMTYSFQSPIEVPGVSNIDFLRMACNARRKQLGKEDLPPLEFYAFLAPKV